MLLRCVFPVLSLDLSCLQQPLRPPEMFIYRSLRCPYMCLAFSSLCSPFMCLFYRSLFCTLVVYAACIQQPVLSKEVSCASLRRICSTGACALRGGVRSTAAFVASRRVCLQELLCFTYTFLSTRACVYGTLCKC